MPEGHDRQHESKRNQSLACPQAEYHQRAANQFNKRNDDTCGPQRPDRQKRICEGQKIFARVLQRPELEDFPNAGHEKDQAEYEAREEQRPASVDVRTTRVGHDDRQRNLGKRECLPL